MSERDINLVIAAKDRATKAVDAVADALRDLDRVNADISQSTAKADGLFGRLRDGLANLDREARGLAALNRVAAQLDKAAGAVGRLDAEVGRATQEFDRLQIEAAKAAENTGRLRLAAEAARAAYEKQKAAVASLTAEQRKDVTATTAARQERDKLKRAMTEANAALKSAEGQERKLADAFAVATGRAEQSREALADANDELFKISSLAEKASKSLGGVEVTQEAVAAASARAAEDMERLNTAMRRQSAAPATGPRVTTETSAAQAASTYRQQLAAVEQAKQAWREAQIEANRLGTAMRATAEPSQEMRTAFLLAQAASRAAKQEYFAQGKALTDLRQDLAAARAATAEANAETRESAAAATMATVAHRQTGAAARASSAAMASAAGQTFRMRDVFRGIYGESGQAMNLFQRMRAEVLALASAYVGLYAAISAIGGVVQAYQSLEATQSRLGVVFNQNLERVDVEIHWLRDQAQRLGNAFSVLADEYGKFAFAAQAANFTNEETRRVFLSIAEAGRVMKVSTQDMSGLFKALTQIMSKGKVQAEELRGQLGDRMSGAFTIFADAIGVTTAELDKMIEQGEVIADRGTLLKFAEELERRFGPQLANSLQTTTAEMGRFADNIEQAQIRVAQGGFMDAFGESLREINLWFQSDDGIAFFDSLGAALGRLVGLLPGLVQNFDKFVAAFQIFAAFKTSQVVIGLLGGLQGLRTTSAAARNDIIALTMSMQILGATTNGTAGVAMRSLSTAMVSLRGVMVTLAATARALWAAIGGLPGLIITGITVLLTSLVGKWLTGVDDATAALQRHEDMLAKVRQGYVEAKGDAQAWARAIEEVTFAQLRADAEETSKALADIQGQMKKLLLSDRADNFFEFGDADSTRVQLHNLTQAYLAAEISAEAFLTQIDELGRLDPGLDEKLTAPLVELARQAVESDRRLKQTAAAIKAKGGAATKAEIEVLKLADALTEVNEAADTSAIDAYTAALKRLGEGVPEIKMQMDFDAELAKIQQDYLTALGNAGEGTAESMRLMADAMDLYKRRMAALQQQQAQAGGNSFIDKVIGVESGGNANARNPMSTATGLGQFTESTWLDLFEKAFPARFASLSRSAVLALRTDPALARTMTELLTEQNAAILAGAGFAASDTNKYLAHFLGTGDAIRVLRADASTPINEVVQQRSRAANPSVFRNIRTAGDMVAWASGKMGSTDTQVQAQRQVLDLLTEAKKRQEEFNAEIATGVSQRQFEIDQLGRSEREQAIQLALRQAQAQALQQSVVFTKEQADAIRSSVGDLYDAQDAERGRNAIIEANTELARAQGIELTRAQSIAVGLTAARIDAESEYGRELARVLGLIYDVNQAEAERRKQQQAVDTNVSNLQAQQQLLMAQIEFAQSQGDMGAVEALKLRLDALYVAYRNALLAKRAFWESELAAGNEAAQGQISSIDAEILDLDELQKKVVFVGSEINDTLAQGLTDAFSGFAKSIAEGANAWRAFRESFLQFAADFLSRIAEMIAQAMILKWLTGDPTGGGGGAGGLLGSLLNAGVKHNGGLVGSGGGYRRTWAGYWANATRYHTGGIVGLRPNEVPIIAERGEEVLDMGDPRHRANGGGGRTVELTNVNVFDPEDFLDRALASDRGAQILLNFISNNRQAVQAVSG